jgi:hypothetical protein
MGRQMSALSKFMTTASAILDEKAAKTQPPFFVRTTWLFAELELLATPDETVLFADIKIARLHGDIAAVTRIVERFGATTEQMPSGRVRHERRQIAGWIKEQIERESV